MDWLNVLDISRALTNCHNDILGDWHRDPWGWPEIDWLAQERNQQFILARLNGRYTGRAARIDVAKENFTTRPAVVLDPLDRLVYQALVDHISVKLIGDARAWVYGWRLIPASPRPGEYAKQDLQWENYRDHLKSLAALYDFALKTDVVSCFASMPIDRVAERIVEKAGSNRLTSRLIDLLQAWNRIPERSGLPQRCAASSVLANMYLAPLDEVLDDYNEPRTRRIPVHPRGTATRWMDDIWLFRSGRALLRKAQLELQDTMRDIGLNMNTGKTDVLEGDEMREEAQRVQHSAVEDALPHPGPLDELIERLLAQPEKADRTSVRFATTRMREHRLYNRVPHFAEKAPRMPHASDALARLFRDSEHWRDLQDWYISYSRSAWGVIDWSVAQFGTMFPSRHQPSPSVKAVLQQELNRARSISLVSLAAQRLAAWDPAAARDIIRDTADEAEHPLVRRALALAATTIQDERAFIRKLLREFEENHPTLEMLKERGFRPLRIPRDFG